MVEEGRWRLHTWHVLGLGENVDSFGETESASFVQNCVLLLVDGKAVQGMYQFL